MFLRILGSAPGISLGGHWGSLSSLHLLCVKLQQHLLHQAWGCSLSELLTNCHACACSKYVAVQQLALSGFFIVYLQNAWSASRM